MIFKETSLKGLYILGLEKFEDSRGFFAYSFCRKEFEQQGLNFSIAQCNVSYNAKRGTLRGLHYQIEPHAQPKLVSCIKGAFYDVALDLRPDSETYRKWFGVELTSDNHKMLYIPEGFAHGFQTLEDGTEVLYSMGESYRPECARGVRWDDQAFNIEWPLDPNVLSEKDASYPDYKG